MAVYFERWKPEWLVCEKLRFHCLPNTLIYVHEREIVQGYSWIRSVTQTNVNVIVKAPY